MSDTVSMEQEEKSIGICVIWRGKKFTVEINTGSNLKEFGDELQKLTDVKADTIRLIVPQPSDKTSKLFLPFSDEHSYLRLQDTAILEAKSIRMMGVSEYEIDEVLKGSKENLRIAGFEEEEKRMRMRTLNRPGNHLKLPQGPYIFCDFRTLKLPGIELNPPASEALKRMHMLAADPGIVAVMNKHRWRVGIMTELAPVGYVGISPKCILGFNKNHGEEISLRLRTDDLKGFRKYEAIKKTLLHELAHMVFSEHDANFHALNKQLNEEASSLDWTRSRSHTLADVTSAGQHDVDASFKSESTVSHKLGGETLDIPTSARAASVAAAHLRLADSLSGSLGPDSDNSISVVHREAMPSDGEMVIQNQMEEQVKLDNEPDQDDYSRVQIDLESDPVDLQVTEFMQSELYFVPEGRNNLEPGPDDTEMSEPDPDDTDILWKYRVADEADTGTIKDNGKEPDPDDVEGIIKEIGKEPYADDIEVKPGMRKTTLPDQNDTSVAVEMENPKQQRIYAKWSQDDSGGSGVIQADADPDDKLNNLIKVPGAETDEPDPDDGELQRIHDPVASFHSRLTKAIEMLQAESSPTEAVAVAQTLFKIIRNVIEHSDESKYRRLRKENPVFQRNIVHYKGAMEVLFVIGFQEDVIVDNFGKSETFLVLKRNDPGLLWLAKSTLEACIL